MKLNLLIGLCILIQISIPLACGKGGRGGGFGRIFRGFLSKSRFSHGSSHSFHGSSHSFHGSSHSFHGSSHPSRGASHPSHGASHASHGASHSSHGSGAITRPIGWDVPPYHQPSGFEFNAGLGPSAHSLPTGPYNLKPNSGLQGFPGYSPAPVSHYNPPVGAFAQPQKIFIQSGQSSGPSLSQLAQQAAVYSMVDHSVKASVNRMFPLRVHNPPYIGHGASGAPVTNKTSSASLPAQSNGYNHENAVVNQTKTPIDDIPPAPVEELTFTSPTGRKVLKHQIENLTERLLRKDDNNAYKKKYIKMKLQEMIVDESVTDNSMHDFLTVKNPSVEDMMTESVLDINAVLRMGDRISDALQNQSSANIEAWNIPTIKALLPLHDNYKMDVTNNEIVTEKQKEEENEFIDAILRTKVMKNTKRFLVRRGFVKNDTMSFKNELKTMWFTRFGRAAGVSGSSGFEYVFLAEKSNNTIIGLHNWIYYAKKEEERKLNYLGFIGHVPLNNKGAFVKVRSSLDGVVNKATTLFVGLSPELEMSLYTLCFYISPGYQCPIKLNGYEFNILVERHHTAHGDVLSSADTESALASTSSA